MITANDSVEAICLGTEAEAERVRADMQGAYAEQQGLSHRERVKGDVILRVLLICARVITGTPSALAGAFNW